MSRRLLTILKVFMGLPVHAQLSSKYCEMRKVEFDFYAMKYAREKKTFQCQHRDVREVSGALSDHDSGESPRYKGNKTRRRIKGRVKLWGRSLQWNRSQYKIKQKKIRFKEKEETIKMAWKRKDKSSILLLLKFCELHCISLPFYSILSHTVLSPFSTISNVSSS